MPEVRVAVTRTRHAYTARAASAIGSMALVFGSGVSVAISTLQSWNSFFDVIFVGAEYARDTALILTASYGFYRHIRSFESGVNQLEFFSSISVDFLAGFIDVLDYVYHREEMDYAALYRALAMLPAIGVDSIYLLMAMIRYFRGEAAYLDFLDAGESIGSDRVAPAFGEGDPYRLAFANPLESGSSSSLDSIRP